MKSLSLIALVGYAFLGVAVPTIAPTFTHSIAEARGQCGPGYYRNSDGRCVQRPVRAPRTGWGHG
jgi:hypothetical protein